MASPSDLRRRALVLSATSCRRLRAEGLKRRSFLSRLMNSAGIGGRGWGMERLEVEPLLKTRLDYGRKFWV